MEKNFNEKMEKYLEELNEFKKILNLISEDELEKELLYELNK